MGKSKNAGKKPSDHEAVDYTEKDGCHVYGTGNTYHIPSDKLFGVVIQEGA